RAPAPQSKVMRSWAMSSLTSPSSAQIIQFEPKPQPKRFVRLDYELLHSQRWKLLRPIARALYLAIAMKFNGFNGNAIGYSVRDACQELHIGKTTAQRAFRALEMLDLIVRLTKRSAPTVSPSWFRAGRAESALLTCPGRPLGWGFFHSWQRRTNVWRR